MGFPVETTDGATVIIEEKLPSGELVAADGSVYERTTNALVVQLKEAGQAVGELADKASEALTEVEGDVETAVKAVVEDVMPVVDAAEKAVAEVGDVLEAAGEEVRVVTDNPVEAIKDLLD